MISHKETIFKAVLYRLFASAVTLLLALIFLKDLKTALTFSAADFVLRTVVYYLYERFYFRVRAHLVN